MPGRWPNVNKVTQGGDSYHPGLQQVAHFDWITRCMEWEGRRPGERWGKDQRMKNRIHSLLKVLGSHWKIKVEEYQLSLYHTKFLPHFKFCMNVEDVVRVKIEKGRLVRSLAISHVRINLGLNQGINCPWRGKARATEDTRKVALLGRLSDWGVSGQENPKITAGFLPLVALKHLT